MIPDKKRPKQKVMIALSPDILNLLDEYAKSRNLSRSHVIEHSIIQALSATDASSLLTQALLGLNIK